MFENVVGMYMLVNGIDDFLMQRIYLDKLPVIISIPYTISL